MRTIRLRDVERKWLSADLAFSYLSNGSRANGGNRSLSVTASAKTTAFVYGADGTRAKRTEDQGGPNEVTTVYFGPVEIMYFGGGANEEILTYAVDAVRLENGTASHLHRDQLASVRAITDSAGAFDRHSSCQPFGTASKAAWRSGETGRILEIESDQERCHRFWP